MENKYCQYVIIPRKPKMSKGKIASQVAHATFMALEKQKDLYIKKKEGFLIKEEWKNNGMCVIVLQCKNSLELFGIAKYFEEWKIPHHLYIDEGLTEVNMGTPTSLATGVMTEEQFWILGTMRLFGDNLWKKIKRLFK